MFQLIKKRVELWNFQVELLTGTYMLGERLQHEIHYLHLTPMFYLFINYLEPWEKTLFNT